MHRAAVLGKPIAHSLSPALHNAGYAAARLADWAYTAIECAESELPGFVAGLGPEWSGLSLTMPLKEAALTVADEVTPVAAAIGAANTLVRRADGSWLADNTDAPGMVDALRASGVDGLATVTVLGAGGTARAAVAAAAAFSVGDVDIVARRAEAVDAMRPAAAALGVTLRHVAWEDAAAHADADLVVSTVPKGVADSLRPVWRASTVLFDAIYDPWPTPLASGAAAVGCRIVSGLDLLLYQAVRQFGMFTGIPGPVAEMREGLVAARTI
ncbi:MAG TPA: shikimate dehydrogenase [Micromonosporaceae bacterium]